MSTTKGFAPGARVLVDGKREAIVRAFFPNGSTSFAFPHYKVDVVGGDKNMAVPAKRVSVARANPTLGTHPDLFRRPRGSDEPEDSNVEVIDWRTVEPEDLRRAARDGGLEPHELEEIQAYAERAITDGDIDALLADGISPTLARAIVGEGRIAGTLREPEVHGAGLYEELIQIAGDECEHCSERFPLDELKTVVLGGDTEQWCEKCRDDDATKCDDCGDIVPSDDSQFVYGTRGDSSTWCQSCADSDAMFCERCEEMYEQAAGGSVITSRRRNQTSWWCDPCQDSHSYKCGHCDERYDNDIDSTHIEDDDEDWCPRCYENDGAWCEDHDASYNAQNGCSACRDSDDDDDDDDDTSRLILGYHSGARAGFNLIDSPWVSAQPRPLRFGVELEVIPAAAGQREALAEQVYESFYKYKFPGSKKDSPLLASLEEDGSLSKSAGCPQTGFEIITNPAGLDIHRTVWPHVNLNGLLGHSVKGCDVGMHIHITRDAMSKVTLGKVVEFTYADANRVFMETVARRSFVDYAKRIPQMKISDVVSAREAEANKPRPGRYEAWNLTNVKTVEFRLPRSTTKVSTILATLEFLYALIRFCEVHASNRELTNENFRKMIALDQWLSETRFLRAYLVDRKFMSVETARLAKTIPAAVLEKLGRARAPVAEDAPTLEQNPKGAPTSYAEAMLLAYEEQGEDVPVKRS